MKEIRLRYLARINPSLSAPIHGDEVPFVPMEAIGQNGGIEIEESKSREDLNGTFTCFENGDVIVAKITPCFENGKGALVAGLPGGFGVGTTELHVLRPGPKLDPRFLFYVTLSVQFRRQGVGAMSGAAGQKRVPADFIENYKLTRPHREQQRAIADFLDRETAKIDDLISRKRSHLTLLSEHLESKVTRTIAKGTNPDAPMTDSGLAQLGYIPGHWSMKRLRHISPQLGVGVVVNPSTYVADDGVPFLFGSNVHPGEFDLTGVRRMSVADSRSLPASMLRAGDLVTVRVGAPGITAVIPQELEGCNCASVLIIRRSIGFQSQWLCYAMNSAWGKYQVKVVQYGAAQEQFNVSHAVNFIFPVPPLEEQCSIVAVLDSATRSHRALTSKTEAQISLLREYRAALISAAVTGQLDIRKHVKQLEALA